MDDINVGAGPQGYLPGTGQLTAFGLGRIAGEHAAEDMRR